MSVKERARSAFWKTPSKYILLAVTALVMVMGGVFGLVVSMIFRVGYEPAVDAVSAYYSEGITDPVSEYLKRSGREAETTVKNRKLPIEDLPALAAEFGAKDLYVVDQARCGEIHEEAKEKGTYAAFSFPEKLLENNGFGTKTTNLLRNVLYGTVPRDGAHEAVITMQLAEKLGVDRDHLDGVTVEIDGVAYEVVGIGARGAFDQYMKNDDGDTVLLSYTEGDNRGTYRYNADSFAEFCERQKEYYRSLDGVEMSFDTAVFVSPSSVSELTGAIAARYPGSAVYSKDYYDTLKTGRDMDGALYLFLSLLLPLSILEGILNSVLFASEKKVYTRNQFASVQEREEFRAEYHRQYYLFWALCLVVGVLSATVVLSLVGWNTLSAVILIGELVIVLGLAVFFTERHYRAGRRA